jgi:rSAM/selenodomain-associated transferase 2
MKVSIIIPTLNESKNIERLLSRLKEGGKGYINDLIVVDGGSEDDTARLACKAGATVLNAPKGRSLQMNHGVKHSTGELLYFVHGDTLPPPTYMEDIQQALEEGYPIGCFRFLFESDRFLLKVNSYFTRFDRLWCRGGDQTLFVTRDIFEELGGYRSDYIIMEEFDFIVRARKKYPFKIIPKNVLVSARKYKNNGYMRVQVANLIVFNMYKFGFSQQKLMNTYRSLLKGW